MTRDLLLALLVVGLLGWLTWSRFEPTWLLKAPRTPPWVGTGVDTAVGADDLESYLNRVDLLDLEGRLPVLEAVRDLLPLLEREGPVRRASRHRLEEDLRLLAQGKAHSPSPFSPPDAPPVEPLAAGGTGTVFALNGTGSKVELRLGETTRSLGPGAWASFEVPGGGLAIEARQGGRVVESLAVRVADGKSYVYSVSGVGGVQREVANYSSFQSPWGQGNTFTEAVAGESWFEYSWELLPDQPFPESITVQVYGGFGMGYRRRITPVTGSGAAALVQARACLEKFLAAGPGAPGEAAAADCLDSIREDGARTRWRTRLLGAPGPRATALLRRLVPDLGKDDAALRAECLKYIAAAGDRDRGAASWLVAAFPTLGEGELVEALALARKLGRGAEAAAAVVAPPPPAGEDEPARERDAKETAWRAVLAAWAAPEGAAGEPYRAELVRMAEDPARRDEVWSGLNRTMTEVPVGLVEILVRAFPPARLDPLLAKEPGSHLWIALALARTDPGARRAALDLALSAPRLGGEWAVFGPILDARKVEFPKTP